MSYDLGAFVGALMGDPVLALIVVLTLGATVVNGATDAPNAIATVVGTKAMRPGPAIAMAAVCNFVGLAAITAVSSAVALTIFKMVDFGGDNHAALIALAAANTLPLCLLACLGSASNVMSAYFQAVDKVVIATVLGMSRYLLFTVPCIIIMSSFMGITGVWWAQPVADVLCFAFTMVFVVRELRRLGSLRVERTVDSSDLSKEGAVA